MTLNSRSMRIGFSLVELLVVISIIIVLMAITTPAVNTILRSTQLTQAAMALQGELASARQRALASNRDIEVRFYQFADPAQPGENLGSPATGRFRAFQAFEYADDGSSKAIGKLIRLPSTVVMADNATLSSLLDLSREKAWGSETKPALAGVGTEYHLRAFRFRPNGSTDLPPVGQTWHLTLHSITQEAGISSLPHNFATIRVDPVNGRTQLYRP